MDCVLPGGAGAAVSFPPPPPFPRLPPPPPPPLAVKGVEEPNTLALPDVPGSA